MNPQLDTPLNIGESFNVHFVWKLPDGDYLRVIFCAEITMVQSAEMRYLVVLKEWERGWQEAPDYLIRSPEERTEPYWTLATQLIGRKVQLAYESADSNPLLLRLATLTGEHTFFTRHN